MARVSLALHQVALDGRNVVKLLKLDAIVDHGGQQRIALRMAHGHVVLASTGALHQLRLLVIHGLQVHVGFLLHDHGAYLILSVHPTVTVDTAVLVGGLGGASANIEVRIVAFHRHLARILFIGAHLGVLVKLIVFQVIAHRAILGAGTRRVVVFARCVIVVIEATTVLVS